MRNKYSINGDVVAIDLGNGISTNISIESLSAILAMDVEWYAHFDYNRYYVYGKNKGYGFKMHRILTDAPTGMVVDHINGDSLDNTLLNLKVCTQAENIRNRTTLNKNNTSDIRGVSFHKASGKWRAFVRKDRKQIHVGLFEDKNEAEFAAIQARISLYGNEESA